MRYDERDIMFSRLQLQIESKEFEEYYSQNPDKKQDDMKLRMKMKEKMFKKKAKDISGTDKSKKKSPMMSMMEVGPSAPDHEYASSRLIQEYLTVADEINNTAHSMSVNVRKREVSPEIMSLLVKEFVRLSGLDIVGIAKIDSNDLYSHRGFNKQYYKYGEEVNLDYQYAIVFAAPLEKDYINRSPNKEVVMSAMLGYAKSSEVAARLVMYIKNLGFDALTDSAFTYHSPISFLGEKAGLGQMGRCNAAVNPKYGNRTKFAAVLTNLPLTEDDKVDFGLKEFCELCRQCEKNCPAKAISSKSSRNKDGEKFWEHDNVACMQMWMNTGNSCGICMSSCPFSQGVDENLISKMKDNPSIMNKILEIHSKKYGKRNYVKEPLDFMLNKLAKEKNG